MACAATENAGPSPAPRMMRQISSVVKLTVPTIGNCATDQITAIASSTQRVSTRLTMKPTTMAEIENRRKNEEPSTPNCSGDSFNSSMIGAPARPTTILSAKFTSMNRNSRKVIFQAPFRVPWGVGCAVMAGFPVYLCRLCKIGRFQWYKGGRGQGNRDFPRAPTPQLPAAAPGARRNRITIMSRRD
jgi:hypothetical protein